MGALGVASLGSEGPGEVTFAHPGPFGEVGHAQVFGDVVGEPPLQTGYRWGGGRLGPQLGAELGLAAGAAGEDHQVGGHGVGHLGAEVVVDEGKGKVDTGGDTGRGPAVPVAHVDLVGEDLDLGRPGQQVAMAPVGGGAVAVEQAGGGEYQGPGADRGDASRLTGEVEDGGDQGRVLRGPTGSRSAHHQQGVNGGLAGPERSGDGVEVLVGANLHAAGGTAPCPAWRGDQHPVALFPALLGDTGGAVEYFHRPGQVQ
ncbi:hypothetical protein BH20ACT3_BH20ACT3_08940 [soil metagenome]